MKRFFEYLIGELRYVFGKYDFTLNDPGWNHMWTTDKMMFHNRFYVIAQVLSRHPQPLVVADIGSGRGELLEYLRTKQIIMHESAGIDFSEAGVRMISSLGFRGIQADISDPNFHLSEKVDFIILAEIVEHIRDVEIPMRNLKSSYRRGIIVTTPNLGYFSYRLRLLIGRFPYIRELPMREHIRFWTTADFKLWTRQLGYSVISTRGCSGFPILYRLWPSLFAYDVLYFIR